MLNGNGFLCNPLTGRVYNSSGIGTFQRNPNATVPVSQPFYTQPQQDNLHVPQSGSSILRPPGLDYSIAPPTNNKEWASFGWQKIAQGFLGSNKQWNTEDIYFIDPTHPKESSLGFSRKDIEYTKLCEKKDKEIFRNLHPRQKRLINAINRQQFFRLSKIKDLKPGEK